MQPTRRVWESLGVATVLGAAALVYDQRLLVGAAALILAWVLAGQLAFVYAATRLNPTLTVTQTVAQNTVQTETPTTATLSVAGEANGLNITVEASPSVGLDTSGDRQAALGETTTFTVRSDVAGTHQLQKPTVRLCDPLGLFIEELPHGEPAELTVEARRPRSIHVGEGGEELRLTFGEHTLDTTGEGIVPAELREYVAGDAAAQIDWKATARLATPYVREFEAESDRTRLLLIDSRKRLETGRTGETAFDYIRSVALVYARLAQYLNDPIGCYAIDEAGVEQLTTPTSTARGYRITRRQLQALTTGTAATAARPRLAAPLRQRVTTVDPNRQFGNTLQPYLSARPTTTGDITPLRAAIRTAIANQQGSVQLTILTDDADRAGLWEAVTESRAGNHAIDVFFAPRPLFETGGVDRLDQRIEQYRDFERFRRDLSNIDRVNAYEIAPQSRIEAVLEGI